MDIRTYQPSDHSGVMGLLSLNTPGYFAPEEAADLLEFLERHLEYYFVAEEDRRLIACGGFNLSEDGRTAKISWDIVHPESQGRGVGTALTKHRIAEMLKIPGVEKISVRTSQLVYRFYERFGLELQETIQDYWAPGLDMYRLECGVNELKI